MHFISLTSSGSYPVNILLKHCLPFSHGVALSSKNDFFTIRSLILDFHKNIFMGLHVTHCTFIYELSVDYLMHRLLCLMYVHRAPFLLVLFCLHKWVTLSKVAAYFLVFFNYLAQGIFYLFL